MFIRLALIAAFASAPLMAQAFEGNISITVSGEDGKAHPMTYQTKDGKIRIDQSVANGEQVGLVLDPGAQKMLMIMTSRRMYMERDFSATAAAAAQAGAGKHPAIARTGRLETIAGYKCEHITITEDDGAASDVCVTSELGAAFRMPMGGSPMAAPKEPGWSAQLSRNAFPLKVSKGDRVVMVVTNIEKKSLDPALFAPPDGFQKFAMPAMPAGMKPPELR